MYTVKEITQKEFEKNFPDVSTYGLEEYSPVFLENGVVLISSEWNGECYTCDGWEYYPVYEDDLIDNESFVVAWYEVY